MLHAWNLAALAFCATIASLSLLRGVAGLLVGRHVLRAIEALALILAGTIGWLGAILVFRGLS